MAIPLSGQQRTDNGNGATIAMGNDASYFSRVFAEPQRKCEQIFDEVKQSARPGDDLGPAIATPMAGEPHRQPSESVRHTGKGGQQTTGTSAEPGAELSPPYSNS